MMSFDDAKKVSMSTNKQKLQNSEKNRVLPNDDGNWLVSKFPPPPSSILCCRLMVTKIGESGANCDCDAKTSTIFLKRRKRGTNPPVSPLSEFLGTFFYGASTRFRKKNNFGDPDLSRFFAQT